MPLTAADRRVADAVLTALRSEKHTAKNYLFLEPFDLTEVPDYLETIGPPLDLRTVSERFRNNSNNTNNSDSGYYTDSAAFWTDLTNVYQNAIQYHGGKPASKWIAKFAKDMLKVLHKERKKAEQQGNGAMAAAVEPPTTSSTASLGLPPPSTASSSGAPPPAFVASSSIAKTPTTKPTKLKLQLPTSKTAAAALGPPTPVGSSGSLAPPSGLEAAAAKRPKLKLKLSNKSMSTTTTADSTTSSNLEFDSVRNNGSMALAPTAITTSSSSSLHAATNPAARPTEKVVPKKAKPTQPKLKLKLSLNKKPNPPLLSDKIGKKKKTVKQEEEEDDDDDEEGEIKALSAAAALPAAAAASNGYSANADAAAPVQKFNAGPSRGKELPQGVVVPAHAPSPVPSSLPSTAAAASKAKKTKKTASATAAATKKAPPFPLSSFGTTSTTSAGSASTSVSSTAAKTTTTSAPGLDTQQTKQCCKVISGLKRRKNKQVSWFLMPVSDKNILPDYKSKIKTPMDLQTIQSKLDKGVYKKVDAFCLDLRRVFANALRYNTSIKDSLRPLAVEVLQSAESLLLIFVARHFPLSYTPLLYCWKVCIDIMDTLYNLVNPNDGQPMAYYFLHPVSVFFGGKFPPDYLEKVKKPMDFGTITANLIEGRYQNVDSFASDCRLVVENCQTFYHDKEESRMFLDQAMQLNECLTSQLSQLARYDKSIKGELERRKAAQLTNPNRIVQEMILPNQPPLALFLSVVEDLRAVKYTDKGTKITEPAMSPFEKPISLMDFPDYLQHVQEPIDLQSIERKVKTGSIYETPEDFEYEMNMVFKNCEIYNARRNAQHSVAMAKFGSRKFRSIFYTKMQAYEDPASMSLPKVQSSANLSQSIESDLTSPTSSSPPAKKVKLESSSYNNTSKGKTAPRISINTASVPGTTSSPFTATSTVAARAKAPAVILPRQLSKPKTDQPVPLHIAIAKVKEAFPLRRAVKSLQSWEADCARYFKELMRHPWISATRPKFVFSCPVPILFPELREHYAEKIRKSMDLTTIECTLLAGNRYAGVEDFMQDVALVFANAIRFNKDGKDVGDPLSCAYYDASVHLLRYSRWLSLELLWNHVDDSDHTDLPGADSLPPFAWKLTTGNRAVARQEVENIALIEPIEKSLEGDRYTWMEGECEKLLKALRHQSDLRYMTFFIQPNYPADYTAFIAKPMDWEKVQRTLKKRHYDTIGALIDDLRLIFSNAEKYNSRLKGTDTVSGRAYEAAKFMSDKLEAAINKLLLSVSDRLERERIDHSNAEREIEAAEQAEEDEIRAAWKKEPDRSDSTTAPERIDLLSQRLRIARRVPQHRQTTDFEIPFFDEEDNGLHERSYFEVVKFQKVMFEKQRQDLTQMRKVSSSIGASVFLRLLESENAEEQAIRAHASSPANPKVSEEIVLPSNLNADKDSDTPNGPSAVLGELERADRSRLHIDIAFKKPTKKHAKRKKVLSGFD